LGGFIGEFLILLGSWPFSPTMTAVASLGVILAAAYLLSMVQRVLYGEVTNEKNRTLPDLHWREYVVLVPLVVLSIVMGIASPLFTRKIEPAADALVRLVRERTTGPQPAVAAAAPAQPGAAR